MQLSSLPNVAVLVTVILRFQIWHLTHSSPSISDLSVTSASFLFPKTLLHPTPNMPRLPLVWKFVVPFCVRQHFLSPPLSPGCGGQAPHLIISLPQQRFIRLYGSAGISLLKVSGNFLLPKCTCPSVLPPLWFRPFAECSVSECKNLQKSVIFLSPRAPYVYQVSFSISVVLFFKYKQFHVVDNVMPSPPSPIRIKYCRSSTCQYLRATLFLFLAIHDSYVDTNAQLPPYWWTRRWFSSNAASNPSVDLLYIGVDISLEWKPKWGFLGYKTLDGNNCFIFILALIFYLDLTHVLAEHRIAS